MILTKECIQKDETKNKKNTRSMGYYPYGYRAIDSFGYSDFLYHQNRINSIKNKCMEREKLPTGFSKMEIRISMNQKDVTVWENILRLITRDFYVYYEVVPIFDDYVEMSFYCDKFNESRITYLLGQYSQVVFNYFSFDAIEK